MKEKLSFLIVGYNEEKNLEKLYKSILKFSKFFEINIFYIDQTSEDNSVEISKKYTKNIFIHENKGYADPDKVWGVNNLINEGEWCFISDADFEFSNNFIEEVYILLKSNKYEVIYINILIKFLFKKGISIKQPLIFKKGGILLSNDIHNYFSINSNKIGKTNSCVISDDIKEYGKGIDIWMLKINKYTNIESKNYKGNTNSFYLLFMLFFSPLYWFFGYLLYKKQIFSGIEGIINSLIQFIYRILLYSKIYEIKINKNKNNKKIG